jgi:hypothetical protein
MPTPELFLLFVRPFNQAGIRYMITGSVAAIFYGEPRITHDVDLVAFLNETDIRGLSGIFPPAEYYVPPVETIAEEVRREQHGHFNIIHIDTGFKADVYPTGRDELHAWAFKLRRRIQFEGETVSLAPPEYVIIRKLEYYREGGSDKHLRDIRSVLAMLGEQLDRGTLTDWIDRRGLKAEWQLVSG